MDRTDTIKTTVTAGPRQGQRNHDLPRYAGTKKPGGLPSVKAYHIQPAKARTNVKDITDGRNRQPDRSRVILQAKGKPRSSSSNPVRPNQVLTGWPENLVVIMEGAQDKAADRKVLPAVSQRPQPDQRQVTDWQNGRTEGDSGRRQVQSDGRSTPEVRSRKNQAHGSNDPKADTARPQTGATILPTVDKAGTTPTGVKALDSANMTATSNQKPAGYTYPKGWVQPQDQQGKGSKPEGKPGKPGQPEEYSLTLPYHVELMSRIANEENIRLAIQYVRRNSGPGIGIDGKTMKQTIQEIEEHMEDFIREIKEGRYHPAPGRRTKLPKPGGGSRQIMIPTYRDRIVARTIGQVLSSVVDGHFHQSSHGFRPGRGVTTATIETKDRMKEGYEWIAELDFKKCFDTVNHQKMRETLEKITGDQILLGLIDRFMKIGYREYGRTIPATTGIAQGNPLSPLLLNILLHRLDCYMGKNGRFTRYADDIIIYARSERAAERKKHHTAEFVRKYLELVINEEKSKITQAEDLVFLGLNFKDGTTGMTDETIKEAQHNITDYLDTNEPSELDYQLLKTEQRIRGIVTHYRQIDRKEGLTRTLDGISKYLTDERTRIAGRIGDGQEASRRINRINRSIDQMIQQYGGKRISP